MSDVTIKVLGDTKDFDKSIDKSTSRDGLAMIKAGLMDEAIKEALSVFTPPEAQLAEADPAGRIR